MQLRRSSVFALHLSFLAVADLVHDETCLLQLPRGFRNNLARTKVVVTTLAGNGSVGTTDGIGPAAQFKSPYGIAIAPDGTFALVSDEDGNTIRRVSLSTGEVITFAGSGIGGDTDAVGIAAQFNSPHGVAFAPDGTFVLVADADNHKIRRVTIPDGVVSTFAGNGSEGVADGIGAAAQLSWPHDVDISLDGAFALVADTSSSRIRRLDMTTGEVTTYAGLDISFPLGVAIAPDRSFALVTDYGNNRVQKFDIHTGAAVTFAGNGLFGDIDAIGTAAEFNGTGGVTIAPDGSFALVTDTSNNKIRRLDLASGAVMTLAGSGVKGMKDGAGAVAQFNYPMGIDIASDGTFALVADYGAHHPPQSIRKVEPLASAG